MSPHHSTKNSTSKKENQGESRLIVRVNPTTTKTNSLKYVPVAPPNSFSFIIVNSSMTPSVDSPQTNGMANGHGRNRAMSRSANDRIERFPPSPVTATTTPSTGAPRYELFNENTRALVYGLQPKAVQGMLDFDFICRRKTPSVAGIIYPFGGQFILKQYWGTKETLV